MTATITSNLMKNLSTRSLILAAVLGTASSSVAAELRLAHIFADHVMFQRDRPVPVWGWADKGEAVTVEFAARTTTATADENGAWEVTLPPLPANSEGGELRVKSRDRSVVVHDVVLGEVWHASGQSNMAMKVGAVARELAPAKAAIAAADFPAIRFRRINEGESAQPLDDLKTGAAWTVCSPRTVAEFSAVAFFFARQVHSELGVPVGIIDSCRGGTPIEPFIPRNAYATHPTLQHELELGDQGDLAALGRLPGGVRARDANWLPGRLYHSRVAPIRRFAARGVLWYQGESNCGDGEDPRDYQHKMRALVTGWRQALRNEDMSFYFVQLPCSGAREGWPYLREQQRLSADLPHTGMVVTIDIDGAGIHPANKIDVGKRLALWALATDYGKPIACSGPMYDRQEIREGKVVVHFAHAEGGLMTATKDGLDPPRETATAALALFELADESGSWWPAQALLDGPTVIVTSDKVSRPVAVRYAYRMSPEDANLYNRAGLPATPFCSDPALLSYAPRLPE